MIERSEQVVALAPGARDGYRMHTMPRHSGEGRNPVRRLSEYGCQIEHSWVPAFAGTTSFTY